MGEINIPVDVKLFIAVTFSDESVFEKIKLLLEEQFGKIEIQSAIFTFNFTHYYDKEMGTGLKKQLLGFCDLIRPESLPEIKVMTNKIEDQFKHGGNRKVNIDPGYLSAAKVVLATTKNFDHRLYLGKGIFGDVHLRYRQKKFHFNPWTYRDYKSMLVIEFLTRLRRIYMKQYENLIASEDLN
ncbi:MAG TPA: DUF4416 family protein [bacterium]|nr:DUF4416 family protein [bacterium]